MEDFDFSFTETNGNSENLKMLLECKKKLADMNFMDGLGVSLIDTIIHLELQVMYIDSWKVCAPIIKEFNKENKKPSESNGSVISLVKDEKKP